MKRFLLSLASLSLLATPTFAAPPGLGVSIKSNDANVYVPINLGTHFRIEPFFGYAKSEGKEDEDKYEYEDKELGLGIFGVGKTTDKSDIYYGARISRIESERTTSYVSSYSDYYGDNTEITKSEQNLDGYAIAPTIGFEYFVIPSFTVGAEASWVISDLDGKYKRTSNYPYYSTPNISYDVESKQETTETRMMFRFYF